MAGSNGFGSAFDTVLDEILEFFRECEQWVPIVGPVLEMLVDIPEGRELELYDLADAYGQAAELHRDHAVQVQILLGDLFQTWRGDGGAQKTQETLQKYLEQLNADADSFLQAQQMVQGAALSVEAAKMMDVVNLIMLAMATIEVIMTIIETFGVSAIGEGIAIATCRQAIKTALKELVEKLIGQGFKGAVKAIMKAGLKRGLQFTAFTVGTKAGILGIQAAEGHDPMSHFDPIEFAGEVVDSFVVGFIGGPLSIGAHNPLTEGAAMALGQLGDNYLRLYRNDLFDAMNLTKWAQDHGLYVDPEHFNPLDGVATAGLFGGVLGAKGMREGLRNARADVRLGLGEKNALGEPGTRLGTEPSVSPRAAGEAGSRSGSETGSQAGSETGSRSGSEAGSQAGSRSGSEAGSQAGSRSAGETGSQARSETGSQAESRSVSDQRTGGERSADSAGSERSADSSAADQQARGGADQRAVAEPHADPAQRTEPGAAEQRAESGGSEQRAESGGTEQRAQSGGTEQRAETGGTEQRGGSGDPARAESEQTTGTPDRSSGQEQSSGVERGDQRQVAEPAGDGSERGQTGAPERPAEPSPARDSGRESTPAGREDLVTTGDGRASTVEVGASAHGQHAEAGGPRTLQPVGSPAASHAAGPEVGGARSGVPESGFSGREPARTGVPDMGVPRGGEPGRTDLPANRFSEGAPGEARGGSVGTDARGGGSDRSARDSGPGREAADGRTGERGDRPAERTDRQDRQPEQNRPEQRSPDREPDRDRPERRSPERESDNNRPDRDRPERRTPEKDGRRWRDYSERVKRWSQSRPAEQAAMDRAVARRFGPGEGGAPRLTPETVQRILDRPAEQLDGTGQRFKHLVEENFTDPAYKDGQPIRRPSSPDDIAARLGELRDSRPPSLTSRLLHIDKLRDLLPELSREVPEPELIHSEHVVGGEYHGFGRPADTLAVGREVRESVPEVLDRLFKDVELNRPEDGGPDVLRTGGGRDVKVDFGAESMDRKHVGTSTRVRNGDVWQVRANSGTRPEHISTVTSHEVAEILRTEQLRGAGEQLPEKSMLNLKDTGARELSPDDHGRIAEMLDWHERSVSGEPGARDRLGELVDQLGLRGDGERAIGSRDAVTELLDNPAAHHFNDAAAGRLSELLKSPELPPAPERPTFTEADLRAIPDNVAQRLGIEQPSFLQEGKVLQMEAHQQAHQQLRLHVEGDAVNTFRTADGDLLGYGHDGKTRFVTDPFRKPGGWEVTNNREPLPDHQHDAAHAKEIVKESASYRQHAADLGTATSDRAAKMQSVNSVLDAVTPRSGLSPEKLAPVTEKDLNATNLRKTIERLRVVAVSHPEVKPHIRALEQAAKTWSTTYNDRTLASNRVGMIAGREYAISEFKVPEAQLRGGVHDDPKPGELDIWGLGRDRDGNPTLVVVEAKGGGAGTEGREHLQQGSGPYLERVMQLDPKFQQFLRDNPMIAEQIRSGIIKVEYLLVSQGHADAAGAVPDAKIYRFTFDNADNPTNTFNPRNIDAR
ncbi:hypothetical protein ACTOB_003600 [Actinoplanes oblitus]|uniref:Outer membrane channel protein CpnT-like N-terminal domain-containing protein n=1 Tax=Actinoplanes oblitus TaxID=3040509 RepID=A0ABY8WVA5_9ACTN|nr:hypothetical protein [Actinoplanes oblitus]WIM99930.1 hypothetical protein ACTOB_003600 [Actinoplanes oblitus]